MAQYGVTHACGHSETIQIYGPSKDRTYQQQREAGRLCRDCYRARQNATAEADAIVRDLPILSGSEKQVAWATTIRSKLLTDLDALMVEARRVAIEGAPHAEMLNQVETAARTIRKQSAASWWIDHRASSVRELIRPLIGV